MRALVRAINSQIERLGEIVICARIEQRDNRTCFPLGGQNEHRSSIPASAHLLQDPHAIQSGQHQVQDDQVVAGVFRKVQTGETVLGAVDGEVGPFAQGGGYVLRQPHLVFHQQNPHRRSIPQLRLSEPELNSMGLQPT